MPTLHELLSELNNDDLQYRLKFLDPRAKATRKAEMIEEIKAGLSGPGLLTAWNELDETSRLAVAEAVHGSGHSHE